MSEEMSILVASLRDMRDAMTESKKQRWSWDEIEAFLGGAMAVRGLDMDTILKLLRGKS